MASEQKGFVVYGNIEESLDELTDEQVANLFRGMVSYFNTGKDPKFSGLMKMVFIPIRQQMDRDKKKYEDKCEKNRKKIQDYWDKVKGNTTEYSSIPMYTNATNINTNTNTNTNTNKDKDTNTMSAETDATSLSLDLIDYLNSKTGSGYTLEENTIDRVRALLGSGYTPNQLRTVIDKKCADWLNDSKMRGYLRPSTLFGEKFPEYLAAPMPLAAERELDTAKKKKSLSVELEQKRSTLEVLRSSLEEIPRGTRMDERRLLKDQIAQLEDSIGIIEGRLS